MIRHQHALVDVVAGVDRREGGGDGDPDPGPLLGLDGGLPRGARALPVAGDDHLEVPVAQRVGRRRGAPRRRSGPRRRRARCRPGRWRKHTQAGVIASVLMSSSRSSTVRPRHREVQLAGQLPTDELGVLGQEEDALRGIEGHLERRGGGKSGELRVVDGHAGSMPPPPAPENAGSVSDTNPLFSATRRGSPACASPGRRSAPRACPSWPR